MLFRYLAPLVKRAVYNFVPTSTAKLELGQSPLMRYIGDSIQITSKNRLTGDTKQEYSVGQMRLKICYHKVGRKNQYKRMQALIILNHDRRVDFKYQLKRI